MQTNRCFIDFHLCFDTQFPREPGLLGFFHLFQKWYGFLWVRCHSFMSPNQQSQNTEGNGCYWL